MTGAALLWLALSGTGAMPDVALAIAARRERQASALLPEPAADARRARVRLQTQPPRDPGPADAAPDLARLAALPVPSLPTRSGPYRSPTTAALASRVGQTLAFATRPGAAVLAPAAGRIVFAGPYRGYGMVVILDHGAGWKTLMTGLGDIGVQAGDLVRRGAAIGRSGARPEVLTLELRRHGTPVDPVPLMLAR